MEKGRPTAYKEEYNELAFKYCLLGATDDTLAKFFEVSVATINNWKIQHPEFLESIKAGKEKADMEVANSLYNRARGFEKKSVKIFMPANSKEPVYAEFDNYYPPDTKAAFIWLKNRANWSDKTQVELNDVTEMTKEQREKRIKELEEMRNGDR